MKWFQELYTAYHCSVLYRRDSATSLTTNFAQNPRQKCYGRVCLPNTPLYSVSKSHIESGTLLTVTLSWMRSPFRLRDRSKKGCFQDNMVGCTMYSEIDLVDNLHQLLKRESDVSLIAASDPSGILWEWLFMPQWLSSDSATLNRLVTQLFRPHRNVIYAQTYFNDIFVNIPASIGRSDVDNHKDHSRSVLECMHTNNLYAKES